jgi:probable rRNA maturation factor
VSEKLHFINTTKTKLPSLVFARFEMMKDAILGPDYELTLAIVGTNKIRTLNRQYRNIDKPTDILSFPLDAENGEMYINIPCTKAEAKKFDRSYENFLQFLFIHGLVHLKGIDHGSTMERIEARFRKEFGI